MSPSFPHSEVWCLADGKAGLSAAALGRSTLRGSLVDSSNQNAYPIAGFTWVVVIQQRNAPEKKDAIQAFLKWMLGPGQSYNEPQFYAMLPKEVIEREQGEIQRIR